MPEERGLHLDRADAVARDLDDLVSSPAEPVIAVFVEGGGIAAEVDRLARDPAPVIVGIALDSPHNVAVNPGKGRLITMIPFSPGAQEPPSGVMTAASTPGSGIPEEPGLMGSIPRPHGFPTIGPAVSVCHI